MDHRKKSGKWLPYAALFVIVLIAACMFWYFMSNATPMLNIPARQMPSPNAYDYYVKAAKSIVDSTAIRNTYKDYPKPYTLAEKQQLLDINANSQNIPGNIT